MTYAVGLMDTIEKYLDSVDVLLFISNNPTCPVRAKGYFAVQC